MTSLVPESYRRHCKPNPNSGKTSLSSSTVSTTVRQIGKQVYRLAQYPIRVWQRGAASTESKSATTSTKSGR